MPARRNAITEQRLYGGANLLSTRLQGVTPTFIAVDGMSVDDLSADFIESIRLYGVLQPVTLMENPDQSSVFPFTIIAGRRRVVAANYLGLQSVPAIVYPRDTPPTVVAAMTLTENYQRRENPVADLRAIQTLVAAGIPEMEIARHLGLSASQVRSRRALANLIPSMRNALARGDLSVRLANSVARFSPGQQRALRRIWGASDGDEITQEMVEQAESEYEEYEEYEPESAMDAVVEMTRPARMPGVAAQAERAWMTPPLPDSQGVLLVDNTRVQAPAITRINEHLIEADGRQYISFQQHHDIVQRLEARIIGAQEAVATAGGVSPVPGTQMIRYGNATYITLEEHNRLVTQATRRARPVESARGTREITAAVVQRARQEGYEEGRQSVLPQLEARIPVPDGLTREEIIERIANDRSYANASALVDAAARAMPAEPSRRSDELHEALGLVRDMVRAVA